MAHRMSREMAATLERAHGSLATVLGNTPQTSILLQLNGN
jgi:hypothetical protein